MSGGGRDKGGSQSTSVTIPAWVQQAAQGNLARADEISRIGYAPYYGPDVAAFQPGQNAAFQNTANANQAFGLQGATPNMPPPQEFAPGVQGYSSAPILEAAMNELQIRRPGQYDAITGMFIDPVTGNSGLGSNSGAVGAPGSGRRYGNPSDYEGGYQGHNEPPGQGGFGGGLRGVGGPFRDGGVFGDGGFFDDTQFDLGLIDGDGRLGGVGRAFGGGNARDGGGNGGGGK